MLVTHLGVEPRIPAIFSLTSLNAPMHYRFANGWCGCGHRIWTSSSGYEPEMLPLHHHRYSYRLFRYVIRLSEMPSLCNLTEINQICLRFRISSITKTYKTNWLNWLWSGWWDSNPQSSAWRAEVLPITQHPHLVGIVGLEPTLHSEIVPKTIVSPDSTIRL